ncbi:MAG: CRISPR-associated endonuclease Cas6 [bacterium]
MNVDTIYLWLGTNTKLTSNFAEKVRGFIGKNMIEDTNLHNHEAGGKCIYRYPKVQYKILDKVPLLVGIQDGVDSVWKIFENISRLDLDNKEYEIFDKRSFLKQNSLICVDKHTSYSFLTPWLALNEENHKKYREMENWEDKKELLKKILVGNIISMSKSLGYTVPSPIRADIKNVKEIHTSLKGTPMLGFLGTFSVNFEIPDYWGIGKSVSRGFGTVKRLDICA